MSTTSKFPVRLTGQNSEKSTGEHLAPSLATTPNGFVSLKTGKTYFSGGVVYVGRPIAAPEVLQKYRTVATVEISDSEALDRIDSFCAAMSSHLIGSFVEISYDASNLPVVQMTKRRFSPQPESKLP